MCFHRFIEVCVNLEECVASEFYAYEMALLLKRWLFQGFTQSIVVVNFFSCNQFLATFYIDDHQDQIMESVWMLYFSLIMLRTFHSQNSTNV